MTTNTQTQKRKLEWINVLYLLGSPVALAVFLPLEFYLHGWSWILFAFMIVYAGLTAFSITAGYHRLLSHRSYEASSIVRFALLLFGAGALQNSALKWSIDHRRHHRCVDTEKDPYNINKGFWWAHMGWVFFKDKPIDPKDFPSDLAKDKIVMWQYRYYLPLALFMCFGVPTIFGYFIGNPFGGLIIGGLLRVFLTTHSTGLINSACHMFGKQPYSHENTARDSWILALFSNGEGYHNFHHAFQYDYRNGHRWYHWDPTKWAIRSLSWVGLTRNLKHATREAIQSAQMKVNLTKRASVR